MICIRRLRAWQYRAAPLLLMLLYAGCAQAPVEPPVPPAGPEPQPPARPAPPKPAEPKLLSSRIAIVLSDRRDEYASVASELGHLLEDYAAYDLSETNRLPREVFAEITDKDTALVIAIGLRAAQVAKSLSNTPVVFCQVFNIFDNDLVSDRVKGVAALPPLKLQVAAWKELNPGLRNVGAILGDGHQGLIDEANAAALNAGLKAHHRIAASDRETLYLFNRLAPDIDGFWLFPDNRVLSPSVLQQMLTYAARHKVQVAVFNPALLDLGATLSTTAVPADVAATAVSIARRMIDGASRPIPDVTPLNEIHVQTNPAKVRAAGDGSNSR